jgi:hypothetical protein
MRKPYDAWGEKTHAMLTRFVVTVAVVLRIPAPANLPPGGPVVSMSTYVELSTSCEREGLSSPSSPSNRRKLMPEVVSFAQKQNSAK